MDTLAPATPRPPLPAARPAIPAYATPVDRIVDTARRLQENVQNMPLTSVLIATILGIGLGSILSNAGHALRRPTVRLKPPLRAEIKATGRPVPKP
jgi:hypothetical protein